MKTKIIKLKKKGGGFRNQKVKILSSGKYRFMKNTSSRSRSKPKKTRGLKMAKRKRYYRKKSKSSGMMTGVSRYVAPLAYGALRGRVSDWIKSTKFAQSFPPSNYTDEILMFGVLFAAGKLGIGKNGVMRGVISHGKTIELSRIGQTLGEQGFNLGSIGSTKTGLFSGGGY